MASAGKPTKQQITAVKIIKGNPGLIGPDLLNKGINTHSGILARLEDKGYIEWMPVKGAGEYAYGWYVTGLGRELVKE